jgi:hypothetical protein
MDRRKLILSGAAASLGAVATDAVARQRISSEQLPPAQPITDPNASPPSAAQDSYSSSPPPPSPTPGL